MQTRMFHPINLLSVCYKHILRFTSMVKIIKRNAGHKHKFQLLFGYFTFQGRHSRAKICFTASEQSSSSRESMFAWPFSLPEIPTWKHLGWGSWTTPNNQWFSYKQHARNFLHMNTWHSHCGWDRSRGLVWDHRGQASISSLLRKAVMSRW